MSKLHFSRQGYMLHTRELNNSTITVGRGAGNDVCFADITVSRKQFSIECQADKWILRDLSGRGTYVNGTLIADETELENGSIIMFGNDMRAFFVINEDGKHYETTEIQYGG